MVAGIRGAAIAEAIPPSHPSRKQGARVQFDRVVVVTDDCVESGGAAAVALASVRQLRRRQIPVTVLTGEDGINPELAALGVDVVPLGGRNLLKGARGSAALRGLFDFGTGAALASWIDRYDTPRTAYHLHNWHKSLSPSVFPPLRRVAARLVMSAHDYFLACPNGGYFVYPREKPCELVPGSLRCIATSCDRRHYGHKLWRVARHQMRRFLFDMNKTEATVLAVHEGMVPYLKRGGIPETAIRVLRNPIMPWSAERVPAERNREVFFVGRVELDKGVDLLADAARRAGARLRVIGDGALTEAIKRDYPEVELLGWKSREEIARLIPTARMFVLPTRWRETFGLVALEALTSGIPVIASRFSLISEEIVHLGLGVACDPHDGEALGSAIAKLLHDDDEVARISQKAFATARLLAPTPDEWCDELCGLYSHLVVTPTPGASGRNGC
jgi:glycosyltransferase involved in cell wall biosynthesis